MTRTKVTVLAGYGWRSILVKQKKSHPPVGLMGGFGFLDRVELSATHVRGIHEPVWVYLYIVLARHVLPEQLSARHRTGDSIDI